MTELLGGAPGYAVPPPFDAASPGDYYLQSTDSTRFKVLRYVLVDNSSYFANLLKEAPPSTSSELPILHINEDARTLHALLALLYPVHVPNLLDVPIMLKLVELEEIYRIPEARLALAFSTLIEILHSRGTRPVDRAIEVFALTWRFEAKNSSQFISRHTHSVDLTDIKTVEALQKLSKGVESFVALVDLRRQRELALDDIIEALEPRKHICQAHSSSDKMFFTFISMIKTAARNALRAPFPVCRDALSFLGLQGTDGIRTVTWCSSCYAGADRARLTGQLQEAISKYPQVASIVPNEEAWRGW